MSREVYPDTCRVRVFLEGVYFPYVQSINIIDSPEKIQCHLVVPPSIRLRTEEWVGASLHIFYANKRVLDQPNKFGTDVSDKPSEWPILFQGELAGEMARENVQSRNQTLQFTSHARHFEQTRLFFVQPQRGQKGESQYASIDERKLFMGNTEMELEFKELPKATRLWMRLFRLTRNLGGSEAGRNIAYGSMALEVLREAADRHPIFATFNRRYRLDERFGAYADPDLPTLIELKKMQTLLDKRAQKLPSFASLMQLLNIINGIAKYHFNHITQPVWRSRGKEGVESRAERIDEAHRAINDFRQAALEIRSKYSEEFKFGSVWINAVDSEVVIPDTIFDKTAISPTSFARKVIRHQTGEATEGPVSYKELSRAEAINKVLQKFRPADSSGASDGDGEEEEGSFEGASSEEVEEALSAEENNPSEEGKTKDMPLEALHKIEQHQKNRDQLNEFCVTPTMEFSSPPKCNVLLPTQFEHYGMQRNFLQEPTRLMAKVRFAKQKDIVRWYVAPNSQTFFRVSGAKLQRFTAAFEEYADRITGRSSGGGQEDATSVDQGEEGEAANRQEGGNVDESSGGAENTAQVEGGNVETPAAPQENFVGPRPRSDIPTSVLQMDLKRFGQMGKNMTPKIKQFIPYMNRARTVAGVSEQQYPNWHICALCDVESRGQTNLGDYVKGTRCGILQMAPIYLQQAWIIMPDHVLAKHFTKTDKQTNDKSRYRIKTSDVWSGDPSVPLGPERIDDGAGGEYYHGPSAFRSFIVYFFMQESVSGVHQYSWDHMAAMHHLPSKARKYRRILDDRGRSAADHYLDTSGNKEQLEYVPKYQELAVQWHNHLEGDKSIVLPDQTREVKNIDGPADQGVLSNFVSDSYQYVKDSVGEVIEGQIGKDILPYLRGKRDSATPFTINQMATPEEVRKGIIANIYHIEEWWLYTLDDTETEESQSEKADAANRGTDQPPDETPGATRESVVASLKGAASKAAESAASVFRSDLREDPIHRYTMSVVEAEFYRRRFQSRSVPAISGGFNPYPMPGFPGLVVTPNRPIVGYVQQVNHQINVAGGTGKTTVSFRSPRYWDEGEVWYWMGGWDQDDLNALGFDYENAKGYYRHFPHWHNRLTVPTNSFDVPTRVDEIFQGPLREEDLDYMSQAVGNWNWSKLQEHHRQTPLDNFYQFFLNCDAVDYLSAHAHPKHLNQDTLKGVFVDRDPFFGDEGQRFHVNAQTLDIREFNQMIASVDEEGKFKRGTLANRFWGHIKPNRAHEAAEAKTDEALEYTERYGIRENELFLEFLENDVHTQDGRLIYVGQTFDEDGKISLMQKQILEYIEDIESREAGGGVT